MTDSALPSAFLDAMMFQYPDWPLIQEIARRAEGRLSLRVGGTVREEVAHPRTPKFVRSRAERFSPLPEPVFDSGDRARAERIARAIHGGGRGLRHLSDALHIVEAERYGAAYFITADRRILDRRTAILEEVRVYPCAPAEMLSILERG
ncbi:hypothetical protein E5163_13520 [Marinicauda algicola]|uniref:PIN domain-containing protein n=1 Tax=Marinicauda algicola TaxID=2029849 RepID=A0A4S2GXW6_9PROT|nr:type II toxin-antitoxin system VapC family toxin [Marinicauda algicola]TGY87926.1 hypothetical protein E5163_13520 [Marinicauda algicola]